MVPLQKKDYMKTIKIVLFPILAATAFVAWQNNLQAQFQPVGDDGIAASPKFREFLDQRAGSMNTPSEPPALVVRQSVPSDELVPSPKQREILEEQVVTVPLPPSGNYGAGYTPTGSDGITASPKLRQMLDDKAQQTERIEIAPLK